jgi:hypothetical protein
VKLRLCPEARVVVRCHVQWFERGFRCNIIDFMVPAVVSEENGQLGQCRGVVCGSVRVWDFL